MRATSSTSRVEVAFTDSSLDLQGLRPEFPRELARLESEIGLPVARMNQVHGDDVHLVTDIPPTGPQEADAWPHVDALVTRTPGLALMVRVADCVPILLADPEASVLAAVHAGRKGMALDVVTRTVARMREWGAGEVRAWVGPHVCGACYEVPAAMQNEVVGLVPESASTTSWGTPALDLGAGVRAQLERADVGVTVIDGCTMEDERFHSFRRDGASSGRFAGLIWLGSEDAVRAGDAA